jgi:hypothetical protein
MPLVYTWSTTIKVPGLPSLPAETPVQVQGDFSAEYEFDVAAGTVGNVTFSSIDKTKLVGVVIESTLAGTLTTNAADGTGGNTFTLAAKKSVNWNNTMINTNPITQNVTAIYFDNTAGITAATVRVAFLSVI